jgi:hypothetical protein
VPYPGAAVALIRRAWTRERGQAQAGFVPEDPDDIWNAPFGSLCEILPVETARAGVLIFQNAVIRQMA